MAFMPFKPKPNTPKTKSVNGSIPPTLGGKNATMKKQPRNPSMFVDPVLPGAPDAVMKQADGKGNAKKGPGKKLFNRHPVSREPY